jgi:hypothetical protein
VQVVSSGQSEDYKAQGIGSAPFLLCKSRVIGENRNAAKRYNQA